MSRNLSSTVTSSPATQQIATMFRVVGWISLGLQLTLGAVSGVAILFSTIPAQELNEKAANPGTGFGIFLAICGVLVLFVSAFLAFRYTRIAKRLEDPNPSLRPKKTNTIKILRISLTVSVVGMFLTLLGAEAAAGLLLAKALTQPTGLAVYNPERIIRPLDVFVIQANINVIAAHFVGIVAALWLLKSVHPRHLK